MSKKINIAPIDITAVDLYELGRTVEQEEYNEAAKLKVGQLRGGSAGCITEDMEVYGTCIRKALARWKGHETPLKKETHVWFDAGFANEEAWLTKLQKAAKKLGPEYELKRESECGVAWTTKNGVPVTGSPDLMIFKDQAPYLGFELKVVCAAKSAIGIYCEDKPKIENLIQTAHYSMKHNCPFILVYSYRSRGGVPGWASKFKDMLTLAYEKTWPAKPGKRAFTKREYQIEPFTKEFKVGFEDGCVFYVKENGERVDTPLTGDGIELYYNTVKEMDDHKNLFLRISQKDLQGNALPYNPCTNCELVDACDRFEHDYESWLDAVILICEEKND